jgi:hypothetical protein
MRGEYYSIGKLDARGNFIPDRRYIDMRGDASSIPPSQLLNYPRKDPVFECRSARLILGKIDKDGNFIPEVGSKVMDFKDYRYGTDYPIWNLPGHFKKKDPAKAAKDVKK